MVNRIKMAGKGVHYTRPKKKRTLKCSYLDDCPECKSYLIVRRASDGYRFIGCTNYPKCTFTAQEKLV